LSYTAYTDITNKIPLDWVIYKYRNLFFTALEAGNFRINLLANLLSGESLLSVSKIASLATFSHDRSDKKKGWMLYPHMVRRAEEPGSF
jgi:hypothetical protein